MILVLAAWGAVLGAAAARAPATPMPSATPLPRLVLDVDRHVQALGDADAPRYRVEVTGRTPQQAFEESLRGFDTLCGPGGGGAPTVAEMRPHRPNAVSPSLVSVDVLKLIAGLKKAGPDRFFLYRMSRPERVTYILNDGRLPVSQLLLPGAVLEPIAAFPDRASATRAWKRMQRGFETPVARDVKPCTPR